MGAEPLATLEHEHEVIERVLALLEREAAGGLPSLDAALARWCVDFLRGFADACHHGKEEDALFPLLEQRGVPRSGGPIGVMLHEHDLGRALLRRMSEAAGSADAGAFRAAAGEYVALLRQHIAKENRVLFPIARTRLGATDSSALAERFEQIERERGGDELHERLHRELETWERRTGPAGARA